MAYTLTPHEVPELLKDLTKNKNVFDLGCAQGELMKAFKPYCLSVKGIDDGCTDGIKQGLDITIGDLFEVEFNPKTIYYFFHGHQMTYRFLKHLKDNKIKGTFIIGQTWNFIVDEYLKANGEERECCEGCFKVFVIVRK